MQRIKRDPGRIALGYMKDTIPFVKVLNFYKGCSTIPPINRNAKKWSLAPMEGKIPRFFGVDWNDSGNCIAKKARSFCS